MMKRFVTAALSACRIGANGTVAALAALMVGFCPAGLMAAIPSVVATSVSQVTTNQVVGTSTWVPGKVVVDTSGNLFVADVGNGAVWEIPANGAAPFYILKGYSGINGVALDSANNLYATNPYGSTGGGGVYRIPLQNGTYNVAATVNLVANFGSLDGYYMQPTDLAVDSAGYAYFACGAAGCGGAHSLFKVKTDGTNPIILVKSMTTALTGIVVDKVGNLYYADGTNVYTVPTGSTGVTPAVIGTGFKTPRGVAVDASNNLYITDSTGGAIYVIPFEVTTAYPGGGPNPAHQYLLTTGANNNASAGIDALGNLYLGDGYTSRSVNRVTLGGAPFPATALGATSGVAVTIAFNTAATPASIAYLQGPAASASQFSQNYAACLAGTAQAVGSTCTAHINFKPTSAGLQTGAYVLRDSTGAALATAYLSGIGNAPSAAFDPAVQTKLVPSASASTPAPAGVAYDAAGNTYVSDSTSNQVVIFPAGGGQGTALAGTTLSQPTGLAVDGAGNLFIADAGNSRLVAIPNIGGVLAGSKQTTLLTGLKSPQGVAIGPDGAVYVADTGNVRVLRLATWQGWSSLLQTNVGGGFLAPSGLAVDSLSNVTVTDSSANNVVRVSIVGGTQTSLLTALNAPTGVGLDAAGNLYVINSGNRSVIRYLSKAGTVDPNSGISAGTALGIPTGLAVSPLGNLAIADSGNQAVYSLVRTSGQVNFGSVNDGDTSAANQVTLSNAGNLPLVLGTPVYTEAGASSNYRVAASSAGGCAAGATLAAGAACGYTTNFIPLTTGTITDTLSFSTNSTSVAAPTVTLTGFGTNLSPTGTTLLQTSPVSGTNPIYGQTVTISATVISKRAGFTPTGSVTFVVDGQLQPAAPLSTSSPYTASISLTSLNGGAHTIGATYSGDVNNASSSAGTLSITVAKATAVITLAVSPTVAVAPGSLGGALSFTGTNLSTTTGVPTGTVNLVASGQLLGTADISKLGVLGKNNITGFVPLVNTAAPSVLGVYQVTAQYAGDVNFNASTSSALVVTVRNPDYDILLPNASLTVKAGSSGSLPLSVQPVSGFGGAISTLYNAIVFPGYTYTPPSINGAVPVPVITLPCTGLPANATCTFAPGFANFNSLNPVPMVLTVNTNVTTNTTLPYPSGTPLLPGLLGGLGVLVAVLAAPKQWSRRSMRLTGLVVVLAAALMAVNGCGSGIRLQPTSNVTPAGTYPITVTFSGAQNTGTLIANTSAPGYGSFTADMVKGSTALANVSQLAYLATGQTLISTNNITPGTTLIVNGSTVSLSLPALSTVTGATILDSDEVIVHTVNMQLVVQ